MAITKRYVELMGGTITVESKKGVGSTFTVELPMELTDAETVRRQDMPIAQVNLSGVKVLMAEDNDLNAEIATIQLEECGIQVTRAMDGAEAVAAFASHPANAFAEDVQASLDAGMNGHLSKPIVMEDVVKTIARNLNG